MKLPITQVVFFALLLLSAAACKKEDDPVSEPNAPISKVPAIELVQVYPATVQQFRDSIIFVVKYRDGDGDLGHSNADSASVYLTDNRKGFTEAYHIPPLAPEGAEIAISGTLNIKLDRTALLNGEEAESVTFTLKIKDRAGHWSNEVTSASVTVVP